jgi:3-dehydroquinate synthase
MVVRKRSRAREVRIPVAHGQRSYDVLLAPSYADLARELGTLSLGRRAFLVTDRHVAAHHAPPVVRALRRAGLEVAGVVLPAGEPQKSLARYRDLLRRMLALGLERGDTVFALGGGVVGDLAGFAAATYQRGIPFVQLPTTLLAMVDAAIGGKVGVNLPEGKNLAGAFHSPRLVYAARSALDTLPDREFRSGLAEVVKAGMVGDATLFQHLEQHMEAICAREAAPLQAAIAGAVAVKAAVVSADEHEAGRRMILNYGHTIGHAIEAATRYRRFRHGEAVALGMAAAGFLGVAAGTTPEPVLRRQNQLLIRAGLPIRARSLPAAAILAKLRFDKKIRNGKLRFVLTPQVGSASVREQLLDGHLSRAIRFISMD